MFNLQTKKGLAAHKQMESRYVDDHSVIFLDMCHLLITVNNPGMM